MALPQLNNPTYKLTLPSSGEKISYRPFLVKEQKVLMLAVESEDNQEMAQAVLDIVNACTEGKLKNVDKLPTFDIEYLFVNIRAKSVGEKINVTVTCPDDETTKVEQEINIEDINVVKTEGHTNVIQLTDDIGITMRYPSMGEVMSYDMNSNQTEVTFKIINDCLENIFDSNEVYEDHNEEELNAFVEQMTTEQFQKVTDFFTTMPKLKHTVKVTNPNTGVESEVVLEGMQSFLG